MGFNTQNAIIAQNAATAAATIVASLGLSAQEDVLRAFDSIRTHIFEGSIALAGAESAEDVPAGGSGGARRSYGGRGGSSNGAAQDPATLVINMGKYKGKTIEAVYKDDSDYLDWLSKNSNNEFLRERVNAFLATVE